LLLAASDDGVSIAFGRVKTVEGAEPIVMVGLTDRLRAGDRVTLDLSAHFPWTRDATP
jgi:hypothetical protein